MKLFYFLPVLLVIAGFPARAQEEPDYRRHPEIMPFNVLTGQFSVQDVRQFGAETTDIPPPIEPRIEAVTFLRADPPKTLKMRVEALVYGIGADLQPEYDHFGYEIRRYMAHIGGPDVYKDAIRLKEELANIKKAGIVLRYWRKALYKEIGEIEEAIETDIRAGPQVKTMYKYNVSVAKAFLAETQNWIDNNRGLMEFVQENQGHYKYKYPYITFYNAQDMRKFMPLLIAREKSRMQMNTYLTFGMMIY